jgi:hypothetical protein
VKTQLAVATTQKGNQSVAKYVGKMHTLGDEIAAADMKLEEEKLIKYILTELDFDFNPIIFALLARKETITISELYTQLLAFETHMELWGSGNYGSLANAENRGGHDGGNNRGRGANHSHIGSRNNGNHFSNNQHKGRNGGGGGCGRRGRGRGNKSTGGTSHPLCQVCYKVDHTAKRCWHRFEEDYTPDERHISTTTGGSYHVDTNWYTGTGAIDHITRELEKLANCEKYHGSD